MGLPKFRSQDVTGGSPWKPEINLFTITINRTLRAISPEHLASAEAPVGLICWDNAGTVSSFGVWHGSHGRKRSVVLILDSQRFRRGVVYTYCAYLSVLSEISESPGRLATADTYYYSLWCIQSEGMRPLDSCAYRSTNTWVIVYNSVCRSRESICLRAFFSDLVLFVRLGVAASNHTVRLLKSRLRGGLRAIGGQAGHRDIQPKRARHGQHASR